MWLWFSKLGSPAYLYKIIDRYIKYAFVVSFVTIAYGLYQAFIVSPPDYQMGHSVKIMYIHVPSAWLSMALYAVLGTMSFVVLVWRIKASAYIARAIAPIGAVFTLCALVTGSLWGKPTWGTYWIWDARLTSELLLLFLYLGYIAVSKAFLLSPSGDKACAFIAVVGLINLPIIHYSVVWWNTLHQGASVMKMAKPSIDYSMLIPLLIMTLGLTIYAAALILLRLKTEILKAEEGSNWIKAI